MPTSKARGFAGRSRPQPAPISNAALETGAKSSNAFLDEGWFLGSISYYAARAESGSRSEANAACRVSTSHRASLKPFADGLPTGHARMNVHRPLVDRYLFGDHLVVQFLDQHVRRLLPGAEQQLDQQACVVERLHHRLALLLLTHRQCLRRQSRDSDVRLCSLCEGPGLCVNLLLISQVALKLADALQLRLDLTPSCLQTVAQLFCELRHLKLLHLLLPHGLPLLVA
mmetsp:Transcript_35465/g.80498  ORF Transcript_35465/g.80498 Transcript_35465/m.80498 type:complete len:228 (+) Transcript_35465:105-788(+)